VCLITDRLRLGPDAEAALIRRAAVAARAGVHLIQVRERDMADGALCSLVERVVEATRGTSTRVLVNDRFDVAIAAGAHGVHLRGDSVPAARVRAAAPASFLIGQSVHSSDEIAQATRERCVDYLLFGTVFETASKPNRAAAGIAGLAAAVAAAGPVPVLAIGGITNASARQLPVTDCAGFAAIGQFADVREDDLAATMTAALAAWDNSR
jgi:thiamine-phosphate pyrophosphorylase